MRFADEIGTGVLSTLAGVLVFLSFLLLATQILVHLLATSFVNAAAFDAARLASAAGGLGVATARAHGLQVLGPFADRVSEFHVGIADDEVTVRVTADSPALVPAKLAGGLGASSISRTVVLRRERAVP